MPRILPSRSTQPLSSPSSRARRCVGIGAIALIALIALAAGDSAAAAAATGSDAAAPAPSASASRSATATTATTATKTTRGGKKTISLEDDFLIEGELDKPSAFFILRRSSGDYDWARLGVEFVPLVLESVQDPLF